MFGKDETRECRVVDLLLARFSLATWRGYHGGPKEGTEKTQWEESSGRFPKPSVSVVCTTSKVIHCLITSWRRHVFLSCFCDLNCLQTATMQVYMKDQMFERWRNITWMMIAVVCLSCNSSINHSCLYEWLPYTWLYIHVVTELVVQLHAVRGKSSFNNTFK